MVRFSSSGEPHYFLSKLEFKDKSQPIIINLGLHLSETEKGAFGDYFDPQDDGVLHIKASQEYSDFEERISYFWTENEGGEPIEVPSALFRKVNFVFYDSLKSPHQELTFYKGRGSGKFLGYLINRFANSGASLNIEEAMAPIIKDIQSVINRLRPLKRQGLGLFTDQENSEDLAARVLKLNGQDGFELQKSGYGVQFSALLLLTLLERLVELKQNKYFRLFEENRKYFTKEEFEIFEEMYLAANPAVAAIIRTITRVEEDKYYLELSQLANAAKNALGNKILDHIRLRNHVSLILGLDEPEIHLHPYMQRSLIRYVCELANNKDKEFLFLLKNFFDIDTIDGQVLIVSHSPAILLDQYQHLIRFCKKEAVEVISGASLKLDKPVEKHLLLNFPLIKEAFFCRCAIVVEGETELGAFPFWANKVIGNLDDLGIAVIKVGGLMSIPHVVTLLNHFGIPNVSLIDKDEANDKNANFLKVSGLRTTTFRDIEEELYETVWAKDAQVTILFEFQQHYDDLGADRTIQTPKLNQIAQKKYKIAQTWDQTKPQFSFREIKEIAEANLTKAMFLAWMDIEKTITLGRALGDFVGAELIPLMFQQLFKEAKLEVKPDERD